MKDLEQDAEMSFPAVHFKVTRTRSRTGMMGQHSGGCRCTARLKFNLLCQTLNWKSFHVFNAHISSQPPFHSQAHKVHSPNLPSEKCISQVVRIGSTIIFHPSELWKSIRYCMMYYFWFLVRLLGKFQVDPLVGVKGCVTSKLRLISHQILFALLLYIALLLRRSEQIHAAKVLELYYHNYYLVNPAIAIADVLCPPFHSCLEITRLSSHQSLIRSDGGQ